PRPYARHLAILRLRRGRGARSLRRAGTTAMKRFYAHASVRATADGHAIDLVTPRRAEVVAEVARYAGTDLVCYRAGHPPELATRQHVAWQPLIDWATLRYDAPLDVTAGVVPIAQATGTLRAFTAAVDAYSPLELAALHLATAACGSLIVALALLEGRLDAEEAFAASQLDETFEIELWGEDAAQMQRRAALMDDIALAARLVQLLRR